MDPKEEILGIIKDEWEENKRPVAYVSIAANLEYHNWPRDKKILLALEKEGDIKASNKGFSPVVKKKPGRPKGSKNK